MPLITHLLPALHNTHTHTQPQYPCTETPIYSAFLLAALWAEGALTSKTPSKLREGGGPRNAAARSVKKRWRVAGRGVLRGLYIILVFIHEFRWRNVPRVWAGKCLTGFHSLPSLPPDWRRAVASVSDLTGYITLGKLQFGNNAGQYGKNQNSGRATP